MTETESEVSRLFTWKFCFCSRNRCHAYVRRTRGSTC